MTGHNSLSFARSVLFPPTIAFTRIHFTLIPTWPSSALSVSLVHLRRSIRLVISLASSVLPFRSARVLKLALYSRTHFPTSQICCRRAMHSPQLFSISMFFRGADEFRQLLSHTLPPIVPFPFLWETANSFFQSLQSGILTHSVPSGLLVSF